MDQNPDVLFKSNKELKKMERMADQAAYLEKQRVQQIENRWNDAQMKAASAKSVIDYAVEQFEEHKEELPDDRSEEHTSELQSH